MADQEKKIFGPKSKRAALNRIARGARLLKIAYAMIETLESEDDPEGDGYSDRCACTDIIKRAKEVLDKAMSVASYNPIDDPRHITDLMREAIADKTEDPVEPFPQMGMATNSLESLKAML